MGLFFNSTREPERIERDITNLSESIRNKRKGDGDPELDAGDLVVEKLEAKAELDEAKKDRESLTSLF